MDTVPPVITNLRIFPVPGQGILNNTDTAETFFVQKVNDVNTLFNTDFVIAYGLVGFGIEATDYQQQSTASLGIYSVELKIDSNSVYEYKMDRFNFNDTRYVNAHIDYQSKVRDNQVIQRCFRIPGNRLRIYDDTTKTGLFTFSRDTLYTLDFTVKDFSGNAAHLKYSINGSTELAQYPLQPVPDGAMLITNEKGIALHKANVDIAIPSGAVYENYQFMASESQLQKGMITPIYHIGDKTVAIHNPITIGIKPEHFPDSLKSKAVLVSIDKYGNYMDEGGKWSNGFLSENVRHFGDFTLAIDTVPPTIKKEYYPGDLNSTRGATVQFTLHDNLSGVKSYTAMVDGKWLLMEYNKNDGMISGDLSSYTQNQKHKIDITVTDEKENETKFSDVFYY